MAAHCGQSYLTASDGVPGAEGVLATLTKNVPTRPSPKRIRSNGMLIGWMEYAG
jgi:hypothetical protein